MKLSHAILEGAQKVKHNTNGGFFYKNSACVGGMAAIISGFIKIDPKSASGFSDYPGQMRDFLLKTFPILEIEGIYRNLLIWNDTEKLHPHEIAMVIASIECKVKRGEAIDTEYFYYRRVL